MKRFFCCAMLFLLMTITINCRHNGGMDNGRPQGDLKYFVGQICKVYLTKYIKTRELTIPYNPNFYIACFCSDPAMPIGTEIIIMDTVGTGFKGKKCLILGILPAWVYQELGLVLQICNDEPSMLERYNYGSYKDKRGLFKCLEYQAKIIHLGLYLARQD